MKLYVAVVSVCLSVQIAVIQPNDETKTEIPLTKDLSHRAENARQDAGYLYEEQQYFVYFIFCPALCHEKFYLPNRKMTVFHKRGPDRCICLWTEEELPEPPEAPAEGEKDTEAEEGGESAKEDNGEEEAKEEGEEKEEKEEEDPAAEAEQTEKKAGEARAAATQEKEGKKEQKKTEQKEPEKAKAEPEKVKAEPEKVKAEPEKTKDKPVEAKAEETPKQL